MPDIFDKLLLRLFFTFFLIGMIFLYQFLHKYLYPSTKTTIFHKFYPSENPSNTLHFFSRIIGIGIIMSNLQIDLADGIWAGLIDLYVVGFFSFVLYLLSIYIMEGVIFYNFDYNDEIFKRKNICYGVISFTQSISLGLILKTVLAQSQTSVIVILFMWMFAIVFLGFSTKTFKFVSKHHFNRQMIQKNLGLAFSFSGFILGSSLIISSSFYQTADGIQYYSILVILKILLSCIILPLFLKGILFVFKLQDDYETEQSNEGPSWGHGLFEGILILTSCFLTTVITGNISFESFVPIF